MKKILRRTARILLAVSLSLVILLAAGCTPQTKKTTVVRLNEVTHSVFYAPQYAAMQLGYFEEEGLTIELTNGGGADKVMTALLSDQADVGFMGLEATIYVYNEGQKDHPIVVGQLTQRDGAFLVGREPIENFTFEALRGKSVIGGRKGGMPEMVFEHILRKNGLEPNVDLEVRTDIQFNLMGGAFTGGTGDFVTLFEPVASQVEMEGRGYVLTALADHSGTMPYTVYSVRKSYLEKHASTVEKFLRAIVRGQKWVASHTPEEIAKVIAPAFPDAKLDVLTRVAERYQKADVWKLTPVLEKDSFEHMQDIMDEAGQLTARAPFEPLVDNRIAEKVSK